MRKLATFLIISLLLAVAPGALAQYSIVQEADCIGYRTPHLVQGCTSDGNGGNASCTLTVGANQLLLINGWFYGAPAATPITDTFSLTWTPITNTSVARSGGSSDEYYQYYAWTGSNAGSETVTVAGVNTASIDFDQVSGVLVNSAPDASISASGTASGSMSISSGSFTTSTAGDLIVSSGEAGFTASLAAGSGFSSSPSVGLPLTTHYPHGTIATRMYGEFELAGAAGSYSATWTINSAFTWMIVASAWKPAAASGSTYIAVCTFPSNNTAGNAIVAVCFAHASGVPGCSFADSNSNTYAVGGSSSSIDDTTYTAMRAAFDIVGGANSVTFTASTISYASGHIYEVHAGGTLDEVDQTNDNAVNSSNSVSTNSVTTTLAAEIIFSSAIAYRNFQELPATWTQSSGWTLQQNQDDPEDGISMLSNISSTQIVSSTGTYSNTFGATNGGGLAYGDMVGLITSFSFGPHRGKIIRVTVY